MVARMPVEPDLSLMAEASEVRSSVVTVALNSIGSALLPVSSKLMVPSLTRSEMVAVVRASAVTPVSEVSRLTLWAMV